MTVKTKKAFVYFPLTCGFDVERSLNLKKCLKKRRGEVKKLKLFDEGTFGDRTLAFSCVKAQSHFYLAGRFVLYPGELACKPVLIHCLIGLI